MEIRPARFAGSWYPETREACDRTLEDLAAAQGVPVDERPDLRGGVLPHAGWIFSGAVADAVVRSLSKAAPDLVVLFGGHLAPGDAPILHDADAWETPYGPVPIPRAARDAVRSLAPFEIETPRRHRRDNGVELVVPLVARSLPGTPLLAIGVGPDDGAIPLGEAVARALEKVARRPAFLGSTDLTHYGPGYGFEPAGTGEAAHRWAKENDADFVDRTAALDAGGILRSAESRRNACCAGAAAAAVAAARFLGASRPGRVLARTTSREVDPSRGAAADFVGYGGVVF